MDPFTGTFDGNGHTISNLYINDITATRAGLFLEVVGGTIKSLNLSDANVSGGIGMGRMAVGALAATASSTTINAVSLYNSTVLSISSQAGGLLGLATDSIITNSFVTSSSHIISITSLVKGDTSVGGKVG